ADGSNLSNCWIEWGSTGWHAFTDIDQIIPLGATVRVRYHAHAGADACTFDGVATPLFDFPLEPNTYVAGLATTRGSPVRWVDVVSR
ncbi:MAG TPA: hypothetical protein VMZ53_07170, partial [Kofleriaceae bacterium]|nr:hypothetical protein [Kofleriaceae bacterium]